MPYTGAPGCPKHGFRVCGAAPGRSAVQENPGDTRGVYSAVCGQGSSGKDLVDPKSMAWLGTTMARAGVVSDLSGVRGLVYPVQALAFTPHGQVKHLDRFNGTSPPGKLTAGRQEPWKTSHMQRTTLQSRAVVWIVTGMQNKAKKIRGQKNTPLPALTCCGLPISLRKAKAHLCYSNQAPACARSARVLLNGNCFGQHAARGVQGICSSRKPARGGYVQANALREVAADAVSVLAAQHEAHNARFNAREH